MATGVQNFISNLLRDPMRAGQAVEQADSILDQLMFEVATEATAGEAAGAVDAAAVAAEGLSSVLGFAVFAGVILVCVLDRFVERALLALADKIPFGGAGPAKRLVTALFWPLDTIENFIITAAHKQAMDAWTGMQKFLNYSFGISLQNTQAGKSPVTQAEIQHLNTRIDDTNARIDAINARLGKLEHSTVGLPAANPVNIKPLQETVKEQGWAIQKLYDNQTNLYGNDQTLLHNQRILRADLVKLQGQLGGVRTVQAGWIDVLTAVQELETQLNTRTATNTADIATLNHRVTNLSPLTLLLQPGLRGLQNLRKLEDRPCQCPQMRFLRPQNIEALAIELAIANGV